MLNNLSDIQVKVVVLSKYRSLLNLAGLSFSLTMGKGKRLKRGEGFTILYKAWVHLRMNVFSDFCYRTRACDLSFTNAASKSQKRRKPIVYLASRIPWRSDPLEYHSDHAQQTYSVASMVAKKCSDSQRHWNCFYSRIFKVRYNTKYFVLIVFPRKFLIDQSAHEFLIMFWL